MTGEAEGPRIYHLALESDWRQAQREGAYSTSTLGRSLAEEGFIHAARADQVAGVHQRFYRGVRRPLVLLEIDTDRLTSPWQEDAVDGQTFPHVYGPINPDAVLAARPWHKSGRPRTFTELWVAESLRRIAAAIAVMLCSLAGAGLGGGSWLGAVAGLVFGVVVVAAWWRRQAP